MDVEPVDEEVMFHGKLIDHLIGHAAETLWNDFFTFQESHRVFSQEKYVLWPSSRSSIPSRPWNNKAFANKKPHPSPYDLMTPQSKGGQLTNCKNPMFSDQEKNLFVFDAKS
jgi:hypothetical protein